MAQNATPRNALIAQSGGPSPVINASLAGVLDACFASGGIAGVYAAWHGIEGVLQEQLVDMKRQDPAELARLRRTPSAGAIGTCRYKLGPGQQEDFGRILEVFRAHGIGYFFYIGGNDSMDTAAKVSALARARGHPLVVAGVPKTIDNDVGDEGFTLIDHTPGYGSAARYWANAIANVNEENRGMSVSECVCVLQAMGRKSGYVAAASRLADPGREMPLLIFFAETGFGLDELYERVDETLRRAGRCIVVVNEGFDVGDLGEARDGFGHIEYGASKISAAQAVVNHLNRRGFPVRGQATGQVPGVMQRCEPIHASRVDQDEAYRVGAKAVEIAMRDGTGWMATILRRGGVSVGPAAPQAVPAYEACYGKAPLEAVANSARRLPKGWIAPGGADVTDGFVSYAAPLIGDGWPLVEIEGGIQRFARLDIKFVPQLCAPYTPCTMRRPTA